MYELLGNEFVEDLRYGHSGFLDGRQHAASLREIRDGLCAWKEVPGHFVEEVRRKNRRGFAARGWRSNARFP